MDLAAPLIALLLTGTPTLQSTLPCVSSNSGSNFTGTGYTPNGAVRLRAHYVAGGDEILDHTVTADVNGAIEFTSGIPGGDAVRRRVELTAEDVARPELNARVGFTMSWFGPFFRPWNTNGAARGRPGATSVIEASGYIGDSGKRLYAHYVLRDRHVATVQVGRLTGSCGALKRRFRQFAFKPVPRGTYSVYFDTMPLFSDSTFDSPRYERVVVR